MICLSTTHIPRPVLPRTFFEERHRCLLREAYPTIYLRVHYFPSASSTIPLPQSFPLCRLQPRRLGQHEAIGLPVVPRIHQPVTASLPLGHGVRLLVAPGSILRRLSCTIPRRRCRRPRVAIALRCWRARPAARGFSPQRRWGLFSAFPASSGGGGAFVVPRAIVVAPPELHGYPTSQCVQLQRCRCVRLLRHPDGHGPRRGHSPALQGSSPLRPPLCVSPSEETPPSCALYALAWRTDVGG